MINSVYLEEATRTELMSMLAEIASLDFGNHVVGFTPIHMKLSGKSLILGQIIQNFIPGCQKSSFLQAVCLMQHSMHSRSFLLLMLMLLVLLRVALRLLTIQPNQSEDSD